MGGKRTHRKCEDCKIITKGIWKHKSFQYCYKCYKSKMKQEICKCGHTEDWHHLRACEHTDIETREPDCTCKKFEPQVNSPQEDATGRVKGEIPTPAGTLSDKIERIWMQILNVKKGKGDKLAFEGCSKQNIKDFIQKLKDAVINQIMIEEHCDGCDEEICDMCMEHFDKITKRIDKLAGKELI